MDRHTLWIQNDSLSRKSYLRYEIKKILLSSLSKGKQHHTYRRLVASFYLVKINKCRSISFISNRCVISGRSRAIDHKTKLSRFKLRSEAGYSNIPGLRRASW